MKQLPIFIITGLSGSGKSTALNAFEDSGFYCVDNMPILLLPKFLELPLNPSSEFGGLAFVMDLREKNLLTQWAKVFDALSVAGYHFQIIFLEADEKVLIQRYSETRRHHPLSGTGGIVDGIRLEREQLEPLKYEADKIVDTTDFTVHELKAIIMGIAETVTHKAAMRISVMSFGFKYGIPHDANLVMDVRFLANPYFIPELKPLDGREEPVSRFVLTQPDTKEFMSLYFRLMDYLIPRYEKEGRAYLTIAVGCTGGRHRSVAVAEALWQHIHKMDRNVRVFHRDIDRDQAQKRGDGQP